MPHARCEIFIQKGLLSQTERIAAKTLGKFHKGIVVADKKSALFANIVRKSVNLPMILLNGGERTKDLSTVHSLYIKFLNAKLERSSPVFAVGGGTITDTVGFAAATFMRGLPLVSIPTTFLGQLDASIGGKTAVNVRGGKNIVGSFYQPRIIITDPNCLDTLSPRDYVTGLAEAVKYAMIKDPTIINEIESGNTESLIYHCTRIKASVVQQDERESGPRMVLNYGHTIGHAIERATNFKFSHGEAISIGMDCELHMAVMMGIAKSAVYHKQQGILSSLGLPITLPKRFREKVYKSLFFDKKIQGGKLRFILIKDFGKPVFPVTVKPDLVSKALNRVLS